VQDNAIIGCATVRFCDNHKTPRKSFDYRKVAGIMRLSDVQTVRFCDNRKRPRKNSVISKDCKEDAIIVCASCEVLRDNRMKRLGIIQTSKISVDYRTLCKLWDSDNRKKRLGKLDYRKRLCKIMRLSGCVQAVNFAIIVKRNHKASICKDCPKYDYRLYKLARFYDNRMKRLGIIQTSKSECRYRMFKLASLLIMLAGKSSNRKRLSERCDYRTWYKLWDFVKIV
jgi:hypothetical protein